MSSSKKCFYLRHKWETVAFSTHSLKDFNGKVKGIVSFDICRKCSKHDVKFLTFEGQEKNSKFKEKAKEEDGLAEIILQWLAGVDNPNIKYKFDCLTINNPNYLQNNHGDVLLHPLKQIYKDYKYSSDPHIREAISDVDNAVESLCTLIKLKTNL